MNNERLLVLEEFLKTNPDDPFNWYALGIEYKATNPEKAMKYFRHLLKHFTDYLATYYQAAELLISIELKNEAEEVLKKGIILAKNQQNQQTLRELQNALNELYFNEDD